MSRQQDLKNLQAELSNLRAKEKLLNKEAGEFQNKLATTRNRIRNLESRLVSLTSEIGVTDHAVLRFLERAMGFDIGAIKERILDDTTKKAIKSLGNGTYPITDGYTAVVRNNSIITITDD